LNILVYALWLFSALLILLLPWCILVYRQNKTLQNQLSENENTKRINFTLEQQLNNNRQLEQKSGELEITQHGSVKKKANALSISHIHLSLTDDDGRALAFVVAESI
jgi:ABC-type transport system involved in Fe-S cluster assembly fused permease/ATPase subunit